MRILLASNAQYYPAHGGGERSNRTLIEALAKRGHECLVITRTERFGDEGRRKLISELEHRSIPVATDSDTIRFTLNDVAVTSATNPASFRAFFVTQKDVFRPDVVVTSTDDPAQLLIEAALKDAHAVTVFLARATIALPFGVDAAFLSRDKTETLRHVDGIVGVSQYVANYILDHSGIAAVHVPIALPDLGPHPFLGRFDNTFVTLANPCAVKGISIFLALARAFPDVSFAGVPTWGTTAEDLLRMRAEPNITVLPKVDKIGDLLARSRVLLAPSLWAEARSRIVVEAMLAGVPVMASNLGGLPEAKMFVPYILPVQPIEGYSQKLDEQMVPVARVPSQDIGPWRDALGRLTDDRQHWEELATLSHNTALQYAEATTVEPFEEYITHLRRKPRTLVSLRALSPSAQLLQLSPERRKLLDLKLRRQGSGLANPALPFGGADLRQFRLFCFAHAGGGAGFFRPWKQSPVQYPGHETRAAEPFLLSMVDLVSSLLESLRPALQGSFAFFGHSMGAIVAFELTRALRREGRTLPVALIASGARAPSFRLNYDPPRDPTQSELIEQVKHLGGLPSDTFLDEMFIESVLPALEADAYLYRHYRYKPEPPLAMPILAIGGSEDPNVQQHHLDRWQQETSGESKTVLLPGGHFYLREKTTKMPEIIETFLSKMEEPSKG